MELSTHWTEGVRTLRDGSCLERPGWWQTPLRLDRFNIIGHLDEELASLCNHQYCFFKLLRTGIRPAWRTI